MTATPSRRSAALALTAFAAAAVTVAGCTSGSDGAGSPPSGSSSESPAASAPASARATIAGRAPTPADPAPFRDQWGALSFATPWHAWCAIIPKNPATPNTPAAGCWQLDGPQRLLSVSAGAPAENRDVQQGFFVQTEGPVLAVGKSLELGGVVCAQAAESLTCTAGGHGFTVHRSGEIDTH